MSGWNGALLGLQVKRNEEEMAKQFLKLLDAETENIYFDEEIGSLYYDYKHGVEGSLRSDLPDYFCILPTLQKHAESYTAHLYGQKRNKGNLPVQRLDEIYHLIHKIFPSAGFYVFYETGNSVSDEYYRHEIFYFPGKDRKKEVHCFYCYGDDINCETEDPREEGREDGESEILKAEFSKDLIAKIIKRAREKGLTELADRLETGKRTAPAVPKKEKTPTAPKSDGPFVIKDSILIKYKGKESDIVIPEGITEIGDSAFVRKTSIETIKIPDGVTRIGKEAFRYCSKLKSIIMPTSLTEIAEYAFADCKRLAEINLPDNLNRIGEAAFYACEGLTEITVPCNVKIIEGYTFMCCKKLEKINFNDSLTGIGTSAFAQTNIPEEITFPDSVMQIGASAFSDCKKLTSVKITGSNKKLKSGAFKNCPKLTNAEIAGSNITISWGTFDNCPKLTSVKITGSDIIIELSAFSNCPNLTITVKEGSSAEKYCQRNNISYVYEK